MRLDQEDFTIRQWVPGEYLIIYNGQKPFPGSDDLPTFPSKSEAQDWVDKCVKDSKFEGSRVEDVKEIVEELNLDPMVPAGHEHFAIVDLSAAINLVEDWMTDAEHDEAVGRIQVDDRSWLVPVGEAAFIRVEIMRRVNDIDDEVSFFEDHSKNLQFPTSQLISGEPNTHNEDPLEDLDL